MHVNEAYGERETGCFLLLKEYLGGGIGVPGSGSWAADYYIGPYSDWQNILKGGAVNIIRRIMISENQLAFNYERLGYVGYPNELNPQRYRYPRPGG